MRIRICVFISCLFLLHVSVQATRVERQTLTQLRDKAEAVIVGTVLSSETRLSPQGKMVWTDYQVRVDDTMLGVDRGPVTTVSFAGGQHAELDIGVAGVPQLEIGATYVLFLRASGHHPTPTVGWGQGLFRLVDVDVAGEREAVLISHDQEPLEIAPNGRFARGARVEIQEGRLIAITDLRKSALETPRQDDPVGLNTDGSIAPPAPQPPGKSRPLSERRFATLGDLRRFLSGEVKEVEPGKSWPE